MNELHSKRRTLLTAIVMMTLICSLVIFEGCTKTRYIDPDAMSKVEGTGIEARDMRATASEMARDLLASKAISNFSGVPRVAVLKIKNRTRFVIDQEIISALITNTLIRHGAGSLAVLNRDIQDKINKERRDKREGEVDGSITGKIAGADFFLEGEMRSLTASKGSDVSDYVVMRFRLTDAESTIVVWSNEYQMKKEGSWGVMYQ